MAFRPLEIATSISGLVLFEPLVHGDERGDLVETYHRRDLERLGISVSFVQDNQTRSLKGVLRGLHFQKDHPQAKLVRVLRGRVFDVAVDLRAGSPTEGRWFGVVLDAENRRQLFIPVGFAHGFLALSDGAELLYRCSAYYRPEDEGGLVWNDPDVAIDWPLERVGNPVLSPRDRNLPGLRDLDFRFRWSDS